MKNYKFTVVFRLQTVNSLEFDGLKQHPPADANLDVSQEWPHLINVRRDS